MLCSICHRKEATVHFKGIFNNDQIVKLDVCEEFAEKKGIKLKSEFTLPELISTLADIDVPAIEVRESIQCSSCGITYSEFKETGLLGCENCYTAFGYRLIPLITRIHGSSKYIGKKFAFVNIQNEQKTLKQRLKELKSGLNELIKNEQYEQAAEVRDQITEIKKRLETGQHSFIRDNS